MTATETWFRQNCEVLDVRALALIDTLPPTIGASALQLLSLIKGWCSSTRKDTVPACVVSDAGRRLRLGARQVDRMAAGLVACGLLDRGAGGTYVLPDKNVIRQVTDDDKAAPASSPKPVSKTERQRRWREKQASTKASHEASTVDGQASTGRLQETPVDGAASTAETSGVYKASTKASTGDAPPLSDSLPPARKQAQTQAQNPPPPPAGGVAPVGAGGGGTPVEATGGTQPDLKTPSTPDAEEPSAEVEALSSHQRYALAYGEGISAATGKPFPGVVSRGELQALGAATRCALDADKKPIRGAALLVWFRDNARAYATFRADAATFERGFAPSKFLEWLAAGASTTKVSAGQTPRVRGQQIIPQPADPGPFVPLFAPMTIEEMRAEKARQKEEAAAKAAGRTP